MTVGTQRIEKRGEKMLSGKRKRRRTRCYDKPYGIGWNRGRKKVKRKGGIGTAKHQPNN